MEINKCYKSWMAEILPRLIIIIIIIQHLYSAIMSYADTEALAILHKVAMRLHVERPGVNPLC